ncbi:MAG: tyrosine-type recombinase/integrase [Rhodospirillaceae bacterium]|nr:tyrosine-type recombinase/integrase [Rhodospirillaceae bacterium]
MHDPVIRSIPLHRLEPSPANVRRTEAGKGAFAELKASIAAHGLLENLVARDIGPADDLGERFAVIAGARRLAALNELASEGIIEATHPVPCRIVANGAADGEISLAENVVRVAMHPADQVEAFGALALAGATVADLAARYLSAHVAQNCNAHTAGIYRGSLENHILPALGMMPLAMVETAHVAALHYRLRETPRAANRALSVLSKMFSLACAWGLVAEGTNPCRGVRKYKEKKRERFLTRDEYRRLGQALAEAEMDAEAGIEGAVSPYAIAALRLLMLTGCRLNEILTLRWDDIDRTAGEFRLRDGKTGARMVPLTPTAETVLAGIARLPRNPWVIVGKQPGTHLSTITADWYRLRARADLDDVRIHDLRHSYASRALAAGESLSMIGKLLGHADIQSTARYAHLARETERLSAARVGGSIGADIGASGTANKDSPS